MNYKKGIVFVGLLLVLIIQQLIVADISTAGNLIVKDLNPGEEIPGTTVYIPMASNYFPLQTIYGVDMEPISSEVKLEKADSLGVQWVRRAGFYWFEVEPEKGERNWEAVSPFEDELIAASINNLEVLFIFSGTPLWAREYEEYACGRIKQEEIAAFATFVHDVVKRYSQSPYNVRYWEIWNEPDAAPPTLTFGYGCWGDPDETYYGGGYYADVMKQVYPAIKSADPEAQVLVGGLLLDCDPIIPPELPDGSGPRDCSSSTYLEGILENGGGPYFDGISFHSYEYYGGVLDSFGNFNWHGGFHKGESTLRNKLDYLNTLLEEYQQTDKFLMSTESALLCDQNCDENYELSKAHFLAQVYAESIVEGLQANVWFNLTGSWRNAGLLYSDLTPRPAYYAYQTSRNILLDSEFVRQIEDYEGVRVFEFHRNGQVIWVIYSWDGEPHEVILAQQPKMVWDTFGNPLTFEETIVVDDPPLYIVW